MPVKDLLVQGEKPVGQVQIQWRVGEGTGYDPIRPED